MSLTNMLLVVIAIGVGVVAVKVENLVSLLCQIAAKLEQPDEEPPSTHQLSDQHLGAICNLLSQIESHTDLLTEPVKEARLKEIIDAVPKRS